MTVDSIRGSVRCLHGGEHGGIRAKAQLEEWLRAVHARRQQEKDCDTGRNLSKSDLKASLPSDTLSPGGHTYSRKATPPNRATPRELKRPIAFKPPHHIKAGESVLHKVVL